jgi:formylglycine-generating enzyme required for sulfatase activity
MNFLASLPRCTIGLLVICASIGAQRAAHAAGAGGERLRDCENCPEMVVIPAGRFLMGTPRSIQVATEVPAELDPVEITIGRDFALGRYEVTRAQYADFARATGRERQLVRCRTWVEERQGFRDLEVRWDAPNVPAQPRPDHPATCVDWHDARAYAAWLSERTGHAYRLPSEAEWEYAAKAGSRALQSWGAATRKHCRHANSNDRATLARYPLAWTIVACDDGFADVAPVGSLRPNAFGLYDMIGNVWEWLEDCSSLSYFGRPLDQRAWTWEGGCKRRIQRGGGWSTGPERSRPGFHGDGDDEDRADFAGFRVARDLP